MNATHRNTNPDAGSPGVRETSKGGTKRPIQPSDICRFRSVGEISMHPDKSGVVYAVTWPDRTTDSNRSVLYATTVDGDSNRQLTHGHRDANASFSPDGTRLAFIRTEPDTPAKVMVLSWPVGEVIEVCSMQDGANDVQWLGNDRLVVAGAQRPANQKGVDDKELARRPRILTRTVYRFNGRGYFNDRPRQLFVIPISHEHVNTVHANAVQANAGQATADPTDAADRHMESVGLPGIDHGAFAVSPDGRTIAAVATTDEDADLTGRNHIWLFHVDGSETPTKLTKTGGNWASLCWHPDGTLLATGMADSSIIGFHRPYVITIPADGGQATVSPLPDQDLHAVPADAVGRGLVPVSGGFLMPGSRQGRVAIDRYTISGDSDAGFDLTRTVAHEGPHQAHAFDASADGEVIMAAITSPTRPAELWRIDGDQRRLTSFNDSLLAELDLPETEEVRITSTEGAEVHAFVVRPPASAPGGEPTRPGLVYVHGGPMFQYGLGFFDEFQIAAACGYVVIGGNPRGSNGYGEAWAQAITGDLGNRDWQDVSAIADYLQALPEVDGERVGIGGGSYGGFMTGWALSHDKRFKAGLIERAVTSWNTMFGTSDIGSWFSEKTVGATIEGDVERVTRQSPLFYADQITTPTLIVHSEEDWRCPIEQAEQLFTAIRRNGGDATFVRFPGENHELSRSGKPSHRIERFEIVHQFYARHLGGADFGANHL